MSFVRLFFLFFLVGLLSGRHFELIADLDAAHRAELSGNLSQAELIYEKFLAEHPEAEVFQRLGLVRHLQSKYEKASQAFEQAIRLKPRLWSSQLFLGVDYYRMNRFSEALRQLEVANQLHPEQEEIHFWLGATHLALHQYISGFEVLEQLLEKQPNNVEILLMLAESYANYGTQLLNHVGEKYPNTAAGLEVQGRAFEFEGSYWAALQAYQRVMTIDSQRPGIREAIARILQHEQ